MVTAPASAIGVDGADGGARGDTSPRPPGASGPASDRKLRVVHCLDGLAVGGTELNAVRTLELLDRSRFDLTLVTMAAGGPLRERVERAGVPIHAFPVPNLYGRSAMRQAARLVRLFRRLRPDVVHCHDCYTNIFAAACARAAGVPLVITSRRWWTALPRPVYAIGNRLAYRHLSHRVLANSEAVARLVRDTEGVDAGRVATVPNFLEDEAFEVMPETARRRLLDDLGVPVGAFVVGCVAKLRAEKDLGSVIRALVALRPRVPDAHLVLVGDGPMEGELRALAASLGAADRVHFAGYRPNRPNPHALFDVSVLASLHEGFPNTIIEAMAVGRPVVATNVGGVPDVVQDGVTGTLVPPAAPERLADALAELAADPGRRRSLGDAGRSHVSARYRADAVLARLEALYRGRQTPAEER